MRPPIRCIATARACAVIDVTLKVGLAKTKGDFRVAIAIASVPAKNRYKRFPLHTCRRLRQRGRRSEARFSTIDQLEAMGGLGGSGPKERDFFVGQNSAAAIFDAALSLWEGLALMRPASTPNAKILEISACTRFALV